MSGNGGKDGAVSSVDMEIVIGDRPERRTYVVSNIEHHTLKINADADLPKSIISKKVKEMISMFVSDKSTTCVECGGDLGVPVGGDRRIYTKMEFGCMDRYHIKCWEEIDK